MTSFHSMGALALLAVLAVAPAHAAVDSVNGSTGGKPKPAKILPQATGAATVYDAVVGSDGTLIRGHAAKAIHLGTGQYEVDFHVTTTSCAYVATLGTTGSVGDVPPGYVIVSGRNGVSKGVFVETYDTTGADADQSFHLVMAC